MASKRKTAARKGPKAARAKTAAQKPAQAKAGARHKPPRRGREIEPKASGTLGIRGSRSRGARELDLAIKPTTTLGGGLTRAARETAPATLGAPVREGLSVDVATRIVRTAADDYKGSIEDTLEDAGMSTPNLRELFRAGVRDGVIAEEYDIDPAAIPNAANTRLSAVRKAVLAGAH